jgi:hypothetical protein
VSGGRIIPERYSGTRLVVRIENELLVGTAEVGRIEIDVARLWIRECRSGSSGFRSREPRR